MPPVEKTVHADTVPLSERADEVIQRVSAKEREIAVVFYHRDGVEVASLRHEQDVIVGRTAPADVVISDSSLSRQHARFLRVNSDVIVEDLGSTNGTRVAGNRVDKASVAPGDEIRLGAVTASIQVVSGARDVNGARVFDGHDQFRSAVDAELERAKFFQRALAMLMVRAVRPSHQESSHVRHWFPNLRSLLRPVDRCALYGSEAVFILMPELGAKDALLRLNAKLQTQNHGLVFGVATYPGPWTCSDALIEACRAAAQRATTANPLEIDSEGGTHSRVINNDRQLVQGSGAAGLVAESASIQSALSLAQRLARGIVPVLLLGETGVGKEVLARFLHECGPRKEKPLVCLNCGAIPAQLVEATLFGHERGAFTGAGQTNKGVFEAADGGSVLLDEIGELPASAQAALLRVLETKRVTRIGSNKEISIDVRILAATHRDLEEMVERGAFRQDLFYRLNAVPLKVPPLRNRVEDIAPLVQHFLTQANIANGCHVEGVRADAQTVLERYAWPGNVRELRNVIERAVVIAQEAEITLEDLPERLTSGIAAAVAADAESLSDPEADGQRGADFRAQRARLEAQVITDALRNAGWNQTRAARQLQMPLRTLVYKIRELGIKKPAGTTASRRPAAT